MGRKLRTLAAVGLWLRLASQARPRPVRAPAVLGLVATLLLLPMLTADARAQTFSWPAALNSNSSADSGSDQRPSVETDGAGTWIAVWQSSDDLDGAIGTDSDILFARSSDGGKTWTPVAALNTNASTDSGADLGPNLATDREGTWVVVWSSTDDLGGPIGVEEDIFVSRSSDNGQTWTLPEALNTNAAVDVESDRHPRIATDRAGTWVAVWDAQNDGLPDGEDILFSRSTDGGETWSPFATLNSNADLGSSDLFPEIATDETGTWLAVWTSNDTLGGTLAPAWHVLVARSTDDGATWSDAASLNPAATSGPAWNRFADVAADGSGSWVAVFTSCPTCFGEFEGTDISAAWSNDDGVSWMGPVTIYDPAGGDQRSPRIAADRAGNWLAAWGTNSGLGFEGDLVWARSTDRGATWSSAGLLNANAEVDSGSDGRVDVACGGPGRWLAVWMSEENLGGTAGTDWDIFFALASFEAIPLLPGLGTVLAPLALLLVVLLLARRGRVRPDRSPSR